MQVIANTLNLMEHHAGKWFRVENGKGVNLTFDEEDMFRDQIHGKVRHITIMIPMSSLITPMFPRVTNTEYHRLYDFASKPLKGCSLRIAWNRGREGQFIWLSTST